MSDDLVRRLDSLHKQATVERSHFYVGSCAEDAMHRIEELEAELEKQIGYKLDYRAAYTQTVEELHKLKGEQEALEMDLK